MLLKLVEVKDNETAPLWSWMKSMWRRRRRRSWEWNQSKAQYHRFGCERWLCFHYTSRIWTIAAPERIGRQRVPADKVQFYMMWINRWRTINLVKGECISSFMHDARAENDVICLSSSLHYTRSIGTVASCSLYYTQVKMSLFSIRLGYFTQYQICTVDSPSVWLSQ